MILGHIRRLFTRARHRRALAFQMKYRHFKALLEANTAVLEIMADVSDTLAGSDCFSMGYVRSRSTALFVEACKIVRHAEAISPRDGRRLAARLEELQQSATQLLAAPARSVGAPHILPMEQIDRSSDRWVGHKLAWLGEMRTKLGMPVPPGFAITVRLDEDLRGQTHLQDEINKVITALDYEDPAAVQEAGQVIQSMLVATPLPDGVEAEILSAYDRLCEQVGRDLRLAVRSSAIGEDDPRCSCAGLYYSAMNIRRESLIDACYEVLVSKYLPRSIMYLRMNGLRDEDMPMCIGCMAMIDPRASGVLFTQDAMAKTDAGAMLIQTVAGLSVGLVNGRVSPERYTVSRDPAGRLMAFDPGGQKVVVRPGSGGGVVEEPMSTRPADSPSLTEDELAELARHALAIEDLFGGPQDIEWAIDQDGRVWILQARPLRISCPLSQTPHPSQRVELKDRYRTLVEGGECASPGTGVGPVAIIRSVRHLKDFPDDGVLVAPRSTPELAQVLHKASAVVTEVGSTTGHLAIMAREYRVPCLMNVANATALTPGECVSVDATAGRIYAGRVPELEPPPSPTPRAHPLVGTPVHQALKGIADLALPLNLTDPDDRRFTAQNCRTLHDISRFAHETAIDRMFALSDEEGRRDGRVRRLVFSVPLAVFVIDVGDGLVEGSPSREVTPEHIASVPFRALIRGMTTEGVRWTGRVRIDLRGFMSVVASTMADGDRLKRGLGDRSYAIISQDYLNFSSRLGYHFSTLDAYVSDAPHANYISFSFEGGAADSVRRERRATFLARVLERLGFAVVQKGDLVKAQIRKVGRDEAFHQLDMCGRLMGAARQIDAAMTTDGLIDPCVERFMQGDYSLGLASQGG